MVMYNDAFLRQRELKLQSVCLSDLKSGHPESSGLGGLGGDEQVAGATDNI